jgi:hypothetical protein
MHPVDEMATRCSRAVIWSAAAIAALFFGTTPASACLACISMPEESLADKIIAADAVALLRPDPDDPFRFSAVEMLKGDPVQAEIPFLVSRSRSSDFALDPNGALVATWTVAGGWAIHDFGGHGLRLALVDLLAQDLDAPTARLDAFGPLLHHPESAVTRMAMIELATLPYDVLRGTDSRVTRQAVAAMLADPKWLEWAPVMVVLLGLSDAPEDVTFVRRAITLLAASDRTLHLAPFATALIEMDGQAGIDWLLSTYIDDPARSETEIEQVGLALASHAQREDATGAAIRDVMGALAASRPPVAAALARAMIDRQDWSLAPEAARWLEDGRLTSPADAFLLTSYVLAAEAAQSEPPP